jgi:hypothetical protein
MRTIVRVFFVGCFALGTSACTVTVTSGAELDGGTSSGSGTSSGTGTTSATTGTTATTATTATGTTTGTTTSGSGGAGGSGSGGAGGGQSDAGPDASVEAAADASRCIDDPTDAGDMPNPDICGNIANYKNVTCMDAMGMYEPPGLTLCNEMQQDARPGAFQVFYNCINTQSKMTTACATTANDVCVDNLHWPVDCQVGKVTITGSTALWDCSNLVAKCSAYTQAQCDYIMNVFNDQARSKIYSCYLVKFNRSGSASCHTDFDDCVSDPAHAP